ncbi:MAG: hypothetical protein ACPG6P_09420 [Akkermansiaceae bacterium]
MKRWIAFFALLIALGLVVAVVLTVRWDIGWNRYGLRGTDTESIFRFVRLCLAVALLPSIFLFWAARKLFCRVKRPAIYLIILVTVLCSSVGWFFGMTPILKHDRLKQLYDRQLVIGDELEAQFVTLRKEGRNEELVSLLEDALDVQERIVSLSGVSGGNCNHGYSYLFVTLHPASDELSRVLGRQVAWYLYDAWHDSYSSPTAKYNGALAEALTHSRHPLLRVIGYWVLQDYPSFKKEAFAGARANDSRMDAMALVAACLVDSDKEKALEIVKPILDRGVGCGLQHDGSYAISSGRIRAYLKGEIPRSELGGYFIYPRKSTSKK